MAAAGEMFASLCMANRVSRRGASAIWDFMTKALKRMTPDERNGPVECYRTSQRRLTAGLNIDVRMDIEDMHVPTSVPDIRRNLLKYSRTFYALNPEWSRRWILTRCSVHDILAFHRRLHPDIPFDQWHEVILSADGVPESKSSSVSFDCVSLKFNR